MNNGKSPKVQRRDPLNNPNDFLEMGEALAASKAGGMAIALVDRVLAHNEGAPLWRALGARILQHKVPGFHLEMLHDADRNSAYHRALQIHAPGKTVLDIGTGSGLLAMMAARAGAKRVIACEANRMLADRAKSVIAANGLADRITVFDRHSTKLDRETDLDGGADLIVSELFSTDLLYEDVLRSLAHARRCLATPDATFLPNRASIKVALAQFPALVGAPDTIEGFDVSLFSPHFQNLEAVPSRDPNLKLASDPATLFAFDFDMTSPLAMSGMNELEIRSTGGRVSGMAQWIEFTFGEGIRYENAPAANHAHHWWINTIASEPCETKPGDRFRIGGWYRQNVLECWCEALEHGAAE
ncbi:50S ribosomal protein L11 methyltransferase [Erythrobacter sp. JK5]|uniref:50S ribosomal protein L11 methyltransferase n=1 Tax=Erythrobacter sp. JK5 TaxID=2829500 RepID=UPI001BA87BBD|nr:50S ribosomal protein L11 methyltransferase [Erythrobacter sp. JK5]QUL37557.1 50S ribosomal protein L11 methyltransferase [Erythrobacter sp. JK5]